MSTDLGVSYYYTNQPDRALAQFDRSLAINPKHTKTILNQGIVRAFGKQDLDRRRGGLAESDRDRARQPGGARRETGAREHEGGPSRCFVSWVIRLLLVLVLIRVLSRLIGGVIAGMAEKKGRQGGGPVQLVRDPICGTYVVPARALPLTAGGTSRSTSALNAAGSNYL